MLYKIRYRPNGDAYLTAVIDGKEHDDIQLPIVDGFSFSELSDSEQSRLTSIDVERQEVAYRQLF